MLYKQLPTDKMHRLAISRIDNLGDVLLTLPMVSILKQAFPHLKIIFIARRYAQALVEAYPGVDEFIAWDDLEKSPQELKKYNLDAIIHAYPRAAMAKLAKQAKIPFRIGTNRRWYNLLNCNVWVNFSRAKSSLHEAQLNLKLLKPFGLKTEYSLQEIIPHLQLQSSHSVPDFVRENLKPNRFNLVLHPCSNGNTREWPLENYEKLIASLPQEKFNILITGTEKEKNYLEPLLKDQLNTIDLVGRLTLAELIALFAQSHGLIAASTGPLHIGAALNIHALGLYPAYHSAGPNRWRPLGQKAQYLVTPEVCKKTCYNRHCDCMYAITVEQVKTIIEGWLSN